MAYLSIKIGTKKVEAAITAPKQRQEGL